MVNVDANSSFVEETESQQQVSSELPPHEPELVVEEEEQSSSIASTCWAHLTLAEISGSLGDLGTFIPLYVALVRQNSLHAAPALFFAGLCNAVTGWQWDLPMPVQPMKSIAAVALVEGLDRHQVTTAGVWMGVFLSLLGLTNLIEWVNRIVPTAVVCGMQLGVGIHLAMKGFALVSDLPWWWMTTSTSSSSDATTKDGDSTAAAAAGPDCILLALICSLACMYYLRDRRAVAPPAMERTSRSSDSDTEAPDENGDDRPTRPRQRQQRPPKEEEDTTQHRPTVALYLFALGAMIAAIELLVGSSKKGESLSWTFPPAIATWALHDTSWTDWKIGLLEGAIPQLPLSTLNSVISVCCLAHTLYPDRRKESLITASDAVVSRREVCLSVGIMNLLLCPLGAMPNCHGAGGLAGQHKFGARYGTSVIFLGVNKMLIAVVFGSSILIFLEQFPSSILGVMLAIAGLELACTGFVFLVQSCSSHADPPLQPTAAAAASSEQAALLRTHAGVALLTAAVILGLKKTHYGALAGLAAHLVYGNGWNEWRQSCCWQRQGQQEDWREYEHVLQDSSEEPASERQLDDDEGTREANHVI